MVNFYEIEKKWQEKWEKERIFEADPSEKEKFFVTVPYPYTSGPFHIGHGRTYSIADIFVRYHRMKGENVLWPMAFHVTGTPVLAISKRIESGDEKYIKLFENYVKLHEKDEKKVKEIVRSFVKPENVMKYFASTFEKDFKALGCSIDWRRKFTTNDLEYNKFIEWQFNKLNELGFLKKGEYPVLYCPNCKNAVGEDDIKSGDQIKAEVGEWQLWKFPFENKFIVCATLRPETIFGVTNLWINPEGAYVEAEVDGETWIISKEAAEKLKFQNRNVKIIREFLGKELINKKVKSPIDNREIPILEGNFVDVKSGSGVVFSVPAHAPYDWIALQDLKKKGEAKEIEPISIIKINNYSDFPAKDACERLGIKSQEDKEKLEKATEEIYKEEFYSGILKENCGEFAGSKIADVKEKVIEKYRKEGKLDMMYDVFAKEKPVYCRCGAEIVVSLLKDQWFINYGDEKWKSFARKCLSKMKIIPEIYRKSFEDTIEWLRERPAARKRGLGTKLPFDKNWIIESLSDSTIYMAFYTVIKRIRENNIPPEKLSLEFWDYILLGKGNEKEVSEKTEIDVDTIKKMRNEFEYWYPVDVRHTAIAHIQNHLTFYIFNHAAIFPEDKWPKIITLNNLLIREGRKMSKSLGNVIPLAEVPKKYGSDLFRLYIAYGADLSSIIDFKEAEIISLRNKLLQFYNLIVSEKANGGKESNISKWLVSRINKHVKSATEALEEYSPRRYVQSAFFDIMNDITYFKRRSSNTEILVKKVYPIWIKLLSPVIPHIAEELWHILGNETFASLEEWPEVKTEEISDEIEAKEEIIKKLVGDINEVIKLIGKTPNKITLFVSEDWKYELLRLVKEKAKKSNLKEIIQTAMQNEKIKSHGKEATVLIQKLMKNINKLPEMIIDKKDETELLKEAVEFLKNEFGCEVIVKDADESKENKAKQALPNKPAILVE
ncbi:MAG: leucine--tRNA ligase [Nanoarchaeota archaeon]|nr:leucine--tRNA ligase [Nanoarchaeota archaeon]